MKKGFNSVGIVAVALITVLLMQSCANQPGIVEKRVFEGYGLWLDSVMKTTDKVLRGIEPGTSEADVRKLENSEPSEEDTATLYYEYITDSITEIAITYQFTNNKVDEIEMMIRTNSNDRGTEIFNDLTRYYQWKYGLPATEKGIHVFSGKNSAGEPIRVSLEDQSGVNDGLVYVLVYRD